jgi:hypothetical protein
MSRFSRRAHHKSEWRARITQPIIDRMEVLLGYLLGIGTVALVAKRGDSAKNAVAWAARQVGALSGKVATSLDHTARVAREEYQRGREGHLGKPLGDGLADTGHDGHLVSSNGKATHLNGH